MIVSAHHHTWKPLRLRAQILRRRSGRFLHLFHYPRAPGTAAVRLIILTLLLSSAVCAKPPSHHHVAAPAHSHEHGEATGALGEAGKRWPADAPLRLGMHQIRGARAHAVRSAADAVALAKAIDDAIGYMIRNCALPADADAALHGVIGQLGGAASALRQGGDSRVAISRVDTALARYAQLFDESDPH